MKQIALFVFFVLAVPRFIQSQNLHFVAFGGVTNYMGDLQSKKFTTSFLKPAYAAGVLYEVTDKLFIRAQLMSTAVAADDFGGPNNNRNLSFASNILEGHLGIEYDILNNYNYACVPYLFMGVGAFHFDPTTIDASGTKVRLQPLGTEGQGFYLGRKKYSLTQVVFPVGGGLKFAINDDIRIRLEAGLRVLLTDYLDDVSTTYADRNALLQNNGSKALELAYRGDELTNSTAYPAAETRRGNPDIKDFYYTGGIGISFRIGSGDGGGSRGGKGQLGCPTNIY
jgi:hypothetical protein